VITSITRWHVPPGYATHKGKTDMVSLRTVAGRKGLGRLQGTLQGIRRYWYCYLMILGTFALLFTFKYFPSMSALYHSVTIWDGISSTRWAGLGNFQLLVSRDVYLTAFKNLALLSVWSVLRSATFPLLAAVLVYRLRNETMAYFFRLLFVLPVVVPFVVRVLVWRQFFEPTMGLLNTILESVGLEGSLWLNGPDTALLSLMFVGFPWIDGIGMLIYLAGLQGIPNEIIEASIVDGASGLRRFFTIELPLVIPQVRIIVILNTISALQDFGWQLVVTKGGPVHATTVPAYEMYEEAMLNLRYGFASAIGVVLFVIIFGLTLVNNRVIRGNIEYQA